MATLAISSTSAARATSRQQVQILPRSGGGVAISSAPSLASYHHHELPPLPPTSDFASFPESMLDFEELIEVDELLTELGMSPPMTGYAEDDGVFVEDHEEALLPPFQTTTSALPPAEAAPATETSSTITPASGGVVRTVSLDQVAFASISNSVPNPMRNYAMDDEPPAKKQKIYTPLLPNPTPTPSSATTAATTAITTPATKITKPVTPTKTTTTSTTKTIINKNITTKPQATIAKSSSIPTLLPSSILSSTATTTISRPVVLASSLNGRKRKLSRKEVELNMSAEELEERRERNRSHAKKSRQRKKAMTGLLEESVQALQRANQLLRQGLNDSLGPQFAEEYLQSREEQRKDAFLQALQNPHNRVVDAGGLAFLKKLQKRIPRDNGDDALDALDDEAAY